MYPWARAQTAANVRRCCLRDVVSKIAVPPSEQLGGLQCYTDIMVGPMTQRNIRVRFPKSAKTGNHSSKTSTELRQSNTTTGFVYILDATIPH